MFPTPLGSALKCLWAGYMSGPFHTNDNFIIDFVYRYRYCAVIIMLLNTWVHSLIFATVLFCCFTLVWALNFLIALLWSTFKSMLSSLCTEHLFCFGMLHMLNFSDISTKLLPRSVQHLVIFTVWGYLFSFLWLLLLLPQFLWMVQKKTKKNFWVTACDLTSLLLVQFIWAVEWFCGAL